MLKKVSAKLKQEFYSRDREVAKAAM